MKHLEFMIFLLLAPAVAHAGPPISTPKAAVEFVQPVPEQPAGVTGFTERLHDLAGGAVVYDAACCKTCHAGKACGDSCISRDKSCHKGRGCACDG